MALNRLQADADALRFLLEFAQTDPYHLSADALLEHVERFQAFLNRDRPPAYVGAVPINLPLLEVLRTRLYDMLSSFARTRRLMIANELVLSFYGVEDPTAGIRIAAVGPPLDQLLYAAMRLLEAVGTRRLLLCPARDCDRLFLRATRKRFCSMRCQMRTYMRERRARERAEAERRARKGSRYGKPATRPR